MNEHDAMNPAPGVKVYRLPRRKVQGLSPGQIKAMNQVQTNHLKEPVGVLKQHRMGGGQGLGMPSALRGLTTILPTRNAPPGTVRPGFKRRSPKMRVFNPVFHGRGEVPAQAIIEHKVGGRLKKFHLLIALGRCGLRGQESYEGQRAAALEKYPELRAFINKFEAGHNRSVQPIKES